MMQALLLIDFQSAFIDTAHFGGERFPDAAEDNALQLLAACRSAGLPIVHVVHDSLDEASPLRLDAPGGAPLAGFAPQAGESLIVKHENGAFAGTGLSTLLRRLQVDGLIVCGLTMQHCVSTSVRMAANAGFTVTLIADACAAFAIDDADGRRWDAETVHAVHAASLHGEFCTVRSTGEWLNSLGG